MGLAICRNLFGRRREDSGIRFKTKDCRLLCYDVLVRLLQIEKKPLLRAEFEQIISTQMGFMALEKGSYGGFYGLESRSDLGYAGIKNLGCICYMLAMLQQFFFQKSFRNAVLLASDGQSPALAKDRYGREYDDNLFHQFQGLFAALQLTLRSEVSPENFCLSFKDFEGESVNVLVQQDAQEFLNMLFDRLENALKPTPFKNILNDIFGGKICSQLTCHTCKQVKSRYEPFFNLSLPIKG